MYLKLSLDSSEFILSVVRIQRLSSLKLKRLRFVEEFGFDIVREFDTGIVVSEGAENLVNFANLLLVFEVNRGIEIGYVCLRYFYHQIILTGV